MRLRHPCEHDQYDEHSQWVGFPPTELETCPGGEFLPEDAMYQAAAKELHSIVYGVAKSKMHSDEITLKLAGHWAGRVLSVALAASQVGDPG